MNRSNRLLTMALFAGISLMSVSPAQALPYDYTVTGSVTGTFNADLSVVTSSLNSWNLTTPTATFTNLSGTIFSNANLALFQLNGVNVFSFVITPLTSTYGGSYSGATSAGLFSGSFTQVGASVPEPSTILLTLLGSLFLVGARWLPLQRRTQQIA